MQQHNDNFLQSQKFSKALPTTGAFPPGFLQEQVQPSPLFLPEFPFIVNLSRVKGKPHLECSPDTQLFHRPPWREETRPQTTDCWGIINFLLFLSTLAFNTSLFIILVELQPITLQSRGEWGCASAWCKCWSALADLPPSGCSA